MNGCRAENLFLPVIHGLAQNDNPGSALQSFRRPAFAVKLPDHITLPAGKRPARPLDRPPVYAMVGNPNCGKTTLFNALTGLRQKVGNYPGVTVEKKIGITYSQHGRPIQLIDLPGAY
ncbi:MAG: FeoB small GTPase domain-containing protein, partial [Ignavibacteriaceae bacterium]